MLRKKSRVYKLGFQLAQIRQTRSAKPRIQYFNTPGLRFSLLAYSTTASLSPNRNPRRLPRLPHSRHPSRPLDRTCRKDLCRRRTDRARYNRAWIPRFFRTLHNEGLSRYSTFRILFRLRKPRRACRQRTLSLRAHDPRDRHLRGHGHDHVHRGRGRGHHPSKMRAPPEAWWYPQCIPSWKPLQWLRKPGVKRTSTCLYLLEWVCRRIRGERILYVPQLYDFGRVLATLAKEKTGFPILC